MICRSRFLPFCTNNHSAGWRHACQPQLPNHTCVLHKPGMFFLDTFSTCFLEGNDSQRGNSSVSGSRCCQRPHKWVQNPYISSIPLGTLSPHCTPCMVFWRG